MADTNRSPVLLIGAGVMVASSATTLSAPQCHVPGFADDNPSAVWKYLAGRATPEHISRRPRDHWEYRGQFLVGIGNEGGARRRLRRAVDAQGVDAGTLINYGAVVNMQARTWHGMRARCSMT